MSAAPTSAFESYTWLILNDFIPPIRSLAPSDKNLLPWVSFEDSKDKTSVRFETIVRSNSESITDEEDQELYYSGKSNPGIFSRLYLDTKNSSIGYLRYNNAGDPSGIYTDKFYIDFDNIKLDNFRVDHFIVGNFSSNYGEGLVFASGDESRRRFTGSKWNKRKLGVSPDLGATEELTLNGLAFQMSSKMNSFLTGLRFSYFISHDKRDAIINDDGSFTSLIFMRPRLGWGSSNENQERIYENMLDLRFGFNYSDVLYTVNSLGEEGRETCLLASLILDTIFPILYVSFFLGIYSFLEIKRNVWYLLPVLVGISDILENIQISLIMVASVPEISNEQIFFASFSNQVKWILCSISLIILLFGLIKKFGKTSNI